MALTFDQCLYYSLSVYVVFFVSNIFDKILSNMLLALCQPVSRPKTKPLRLNHSAVRSMFFTYENKENVIKF